MPFNERQFILPGQRAQQAAAAAAASTKKTTDQQSALQAAAKNAFGDINRGDYAGAWDAARGLNSAYGYTAGSTQTNPLAEAMMSSQGLQAIDPSKKWTADDMQKYYSAFNNNLTTNGGGSNFGDNPYGLWGDRGSFGGDATTNSQTAGDSTAPDIARFAGARPTKSFLGKYGADIAALAATVVTWGAAAPLVFAAAAGTGIAANALSGNATTWGSVGKTLASSAIGAFAPGAGGWLGSDAGLGIGATAGGALAGAGAGALRSEINGGNPLTGAITGGIGGGIGGSGVLKNIGNGISGATDGSISPFWGNVIAGTGAGLGTQYLGGQINKALAPDPTHPGIMQPPASAPATTSPAAAIASHPSGAPPGHATASQGVPTGQPTPTAPTGAAPANIGNYSGYTAGLGYQPYQQTGPVADPTHYGQGPEQAMFTPIG